MPVDTSSGDWKQVVDGARTSLLAMGGPREIETMIVSIPDPIDSGFVYFFDVELQAVEMALEVPLAAGVGPAQYYRDRSWLPWDDRYQDGQARKLSEDCRLETPGVVLLRGDPGVMVVLLVGESATVGIHREAMDRALEAESILNTHKNEEGCAPGEHTAAPGCTRIIGPTFSGSASSLARALYQRVDPERGVQIISGTASGPGVPGLLKLPSHPGWGPVTYQATTVPEQATECAFLYLARRLGASEVARASSEPTALEATAVLSESGTEFGSGLRQTPDVGSSWGHGSPCEYQPEVHLAFPFHVAALRDAYTDLEKAAPPATDVEQAIARRTSLPASLHESRTALDIPAKPSSKTISAQDVALSHVLSEISREGIQYVAIEATDPADSIFLAQKIRDIAPDVRLAFLDADALFTHPDFERSLIGSFVISPYPFLGADDFVPRQIGAPAAGAAVTPHSHVPFENANAEGTFNAVLAQRGARPQDLEEYVFADPTDEGETTAAQLPLWISTIAHGELVPVSTRPAVDCAGTIYGREQVAGQTRLCNSRLPAAQKSAWSEFNALQIQSLRVDPDVTPPRFWHFVYATLVFMLLFDWSFGRRIEARLAPPVEHGDESIVSDRDIDVTVGRTKILFYLSVRRLVLFIAVFYMSVVCWIATLCYKVGTTSAVVRTLVTIPTVLGFAACLIVYRRFLGEYRRLGSWRGRYLPGAETTRIEPGPHSPAWIGSLASAAMAVVGWLGFAPVVHRQAAVSTPYARIRLFHAVVGIVTIGFFVGLFWTLLIDIGFRYGHGGPVPALTLFVLRTLPLANGVSFAAPALLSILCVYLWAAGRVARLTLAHSLSRMTSDDGLLDGVSTPLYAILYPSTGDGVVHGSDKTGFGREERALLNTIWSPGAGLGYFVVLLVVCFFPIVLFALKPPTSLDPRWDTRLLAGAIGICGVIVAATLIQLGQYWSAFSSVLKRMANHPFAKSFKKVLPFVREDLDAQISRPPDDLARLVACGNAYRALLAPEGAAGADLSMRLQLIDEALDDALNQSSKRDTRAAATSEARLGRLLIEAAGALAHHLLAGDDKGAPADWQAGGRRWVATVLALVVNRHVRQFRHFLYTTTGCALILLLTTLSYPFEPQRAILTCLWGLTLMVVFSGLTVFVMMNRDTLLSYITQTTPGHLDLDAALFTRVVQWVIVPLALVAAAQYPQIASKAFTLIDPIIHTLR